MCMSANPRIHGLQNRCNAGWRPVVREKAFLGSPSPSAVTWRASYNLSTFEFIFLSRKQLFPTTLTIPQLCCASPSSSTLSFSVSSLSPLVWRFLPPSPPLIAITISWDEPSIMSGLTPLPYPLEIQMISISVVEKDFTIDWTNLDAGWAQLFVHLPLLSMSESSSTPPSPILGLWRA